MSATGETGPVGFVGLGNMGMPMASHLLTTGFAVVGCDQRSPVGAAFRAAGGQWAENPRAVADRCKVVMVCLPTPAAVEQVVLGPDGLAKGRALELYVDLSTTGPILARRIAEQLQERGITAVDAPVSGGVAGAEQARLSVIVSGPRAAFDRIEKLLACFGGRRFHVGEKAGMGQLLKLLNNLLSTTALAATYEALSVGVKAGLDPATMIEVLSESSGTNHAIEYKIPRFVLPGKPMGFSLDLSFKDVSLGVEAGEALGVPMRMGRVTRDMWQEAMNLVGAKEDYLQVVRLFERAAGVRLAPGER